MFPNINPRKMQKMMKSLGMKQQDLEAEEVIIKCRNKELIIRNPQVSKIEAMGQQTLQIIGNIEEKELKNYKEEDIKTVVEKANVDENTAKQALEETNGNLAEAIIKLGNQ